MIRSAIIPCTVVLATLASCGKESAPAPPSTPAPASPASTGAPPPNPLGSNAAPQPASSDASSAATITTDADGPTRLLAQGFVLDLPATWTQQTPTSSMRAAQYAAPAPEGSGLDAAEFVVFRGIGGSPEDNIARWEGQVTDRPVEPVRTSTTAHGFTVDAILLYGTYDAGMAMGGTGPKPDWGFAGAVISGGPEGTLFLRLSGPRAVVESHRAEWEAMLASILTNAAPGMR
jgi:hypothetical protein